MGERKGQNKYYPPDYDPRVGGLNKFLGTHALRERARKLHLGILIIRFEMPYNIWCDGCGNHIGMGVRYNAEKTKVGMYYSTPVYQFRMKCHLCDNHIEMKTDPGNLDYIIVSGARRQERRWDPTTNEQVVPEDKRVSKQLSSDPMFKLAHVVDDKTKSKNVTPTLALLENLQERKKDDYMANRLLRDKFRAKKKELKAAEDKDSAVLKKFSLVIPLLKESEDDQHVASLIRLQPSLSSEDRQKDARKQIENRSMFPFSTPSLSHTILSSEDDKLKKRNNLGITFRSKCLPLPHTEVSSSMSTSPNVSDEPIPTQRDRDGNSTSSGRLEANETKLDIQSSFSSSFGQNIKSNGSLSLISCDYGSSESNSSD